MKKLLNPEIVKCDRCGVVDACCATTDGGYYLCQFCERKIIFDSTLSDLVGKTQEICEKKKMKLEIGVPNISYRTGYNAALSDLQSSLEQLKKKMGL